jgi:transcriptional regulator with XRE-family HTH domain
MALKNFHNIVAETPEEVTNFVSHSMDILDRIHELLELKFQGKQKLLADKLGKSEAEISKILSGVQNFTLKTLCKLEWAFDAKIISVCSDDLITGFIPVRTGIREGYRQIIVSRSETKKEIEFREIKVKPANAGTKTIHCAS